MRRITRLGTRLFATALVLGTIWLPAQQALAQSWNGPASLGVSVKNGKGQPLTGALVTVAYRDFGFGDGPPPRRTTERGEANFTGLSEGTWSLKVDHPDHLSYMATVVLRQGKKPQVLSEFLEATGAGRQTMRVKQLKASSENRGEPVERERTAAPPQPAPTAVVATQPAPTPEPETQVKPEPTPATEEARRQPAPAAGAPEGTSAPAVASKPAVAGASSERVEVPSVEMPAAEIPAGEVPQGEAVLPDAPSTEIPRIETPPQIGTEAAATAEPSPVDGQVASEISPEPEADETRLTGERELPEGRDTSTGATIGTAPAPPVEPTAVAAAMPTTMPTASSFRKPEAEPSTAAAGTPSGIPADDVPFGPDIEAAARATAPGATAPPAEPSMPESVESAATLTTANDSRSDEAQSLRAAAAAPPVQLAQAPAKESLQSYADRSCAECRPGEWSVSSTVSVAPQAPADCLAGEEEIGSQMRRLAGTVGERLADFSGPLPAGDLDLQASLSHHLNDCGLVAVVIPEGARFSGFRLQAADPSGDGDCVAGRTCPIGDCRWVFSPGATEGAGAILIYSVFQNSSTYQERSATLTAYFIPPSGWSAEPGESR